MSEPIVAREPVLPPAHRRRLLVVVGGLGLVAAVGVLALVILHKKPSAAELPAEVIEQRLTDAVAEADRADPRWHFADLEADRAKVPFEENAAPLVMACVVLLPKELNDLDTNGLRRQLRNGEIDDNPRQRIEPARAMLGEARKLARFSRGRHAVKWALPNPLDTPLPHVAVTRDVVDLLTLDAEVSAHEGQTDNALVSIRAALVAVRTIGDEPSPISQASRPTWEHYAVGALEESLRRSPGIAVTRPALGASTVGLLGSPRGQGPFLAAPAPVALMGTEARLLGVQQALEAEAAEPVLRTTARAGRAGLHALMTSLENGDVTRAELSAVGDQGEGTGLIQTRRPDTLKAIHAWLLDYMTKFVAITELPSQDQAPHLKELAATVPEAPPEALPLLRAFDIRDIAAKCHNGRALLRCGAVGMALERCRLTNGRWPDTLAALVPTYLKEVPADPFDGKPLRYLRTPDGVVVYSVGAAGKEVAGMHDLESFAKTGAADLSFRLWNVADRGKKK